MWLAVTWVGWTKGPKLATSLGCFLARVDISGGASWPDCIDEIVEICWMRQCGQRWPKLARQRSER